jgi:peptidoglycan hydrolase CwlO-like protein
MEKNRRSLLQALFTVAVPMVFFAAARGQDASSSKTGPIRPDDDANLPAKSSTKTVLEENQKDIKKNVEKLFDLASQLKDQVEKTDATTVLSLAMVKKAEEIERLARQIKERAKG